MLEKARKIKELTSQEGKILESPAPSSIRLSAMQFYRYGLIGIASNFSGYLIFLLITHLGVEPKKSMSLLYMTGATIGFFGNRKWTFSHKGTALKSGVRYCIAHLFGYALNFSLLLIFVDILGYSHALVQAVAIFVVAGFLFVTFKYLVFPTTNVSEENRR